jgi:hypothetical protein
MKATYELVSTFLLQVHLATRRRGQTLDPLKTAPKLLALADDLPQPAIELDELTLQQRDQLMELRTRHACFLIARPRRVQECAERDGTR